MLRVASGHGVHERRGAEVRAGDFAAAAALILAVTLGWLAFRQPAAPREEFARERQSSPSPNPTGAQPTDFELFHTDSPFNSWPTKWSFLLAYVTPPEGADTEFVDTRAVYEDLPQAMKDKVEGLRVEHDLFRALQRNGVKFEDEAMRRNYPRKTHPLVRTSASVPAS